MKLLRDLTFIDLIGIVLAITMGWAILEAAK